MVFFVWLQKLLILNVQNVGPEKLRKLKPNFTGSVNMSILGTLNLLNLISRKICLAGYSTRFHNVNHSPPPMQRIKVMKKLSK